MGRVMLGMPGPWAEDYREKSDHYTTKIGGVPDWPDLGINSNLVKCVLCGGKLCLVAQVYAPISLPTLKIEERVIYILGCPTAKCGSDPHSWRVLRAQKCDVEPQLENTGQKRMSSGENCRSISKSSNFLEDLSNDGPEERIDGNNDALDLSGLAQALSEVATLASNSKKKNGAVQSKSSRKRSVTKPRVKSANLPVLPCFYVYSEESSLGANCTMLSMKESQNASSDHEDEEKWEGETYEYDKALGADRTYLKFKKHVDAYPEQCFRYSCGDKPLLATAMQRGPESCSLCGSARHYEMQLMPPLIYFLSEATDDSSTKVPEEWSWLTLIIYTCSKSCCPSSCTEKSVNCCWAVAEEAAIVQDE